MLIKGGPFLKGDLDAIKRDWSRREFFPEGYNPDTTKYKTDSKGRTLYNKDGSPMKDEEPGIIKKGIEKIKKLVNPLEGLSQRPTPRTPPLPSTPMPNVATAAANTNPTTGLTRTESALLSPEEQEIARRT